PAIGAEILGEHTGGLLGMARRIALAHHEKWDGSGYPEGLAGDSIPIEARIVAIADVFDALTSIRPYKPAWPVEQAVEHLRAQAGRHFDPALVELFVSVLPKVVEVRERFLEEE
ncbi:HD domain-containing phosphohydrolase, partial [Roseateles sp.]|uniref:HD-GYP domain-containing protein n=1 Tax=Roseateles sp. TaxID=1971397 RepID=UPI0031E461FC